MEDAYRELYQEFIRLRALCLKQAAMLHQLTAALQKQKGVNNPNGEFHGIQCTDKSPAFLGEDPGPLTATAHNMTTQCGFELLSRNMGTFSDLLDQDMRKLDMNVRCQRKEERNVEHKAPPISALESSGWHGASSIVSKSPKQDPPIGDWMLKSAWMPGTYSPAFNGLLNHSGDLVMSDVALQSHICQFCQAVFPGTTTTRGEYLRHLDTHIT